MFYCMTNCSEMAVCILIIEVKSIFKFVLKNDHYGKCIVCPLDVAFEAFSVDFISQSYKEMYTKVCTCSDIWEIRSLICFRLHYGKHIKWNGCGYSVSLWNVESGFNYPMNNESPLKSEFNPNYYIFFYVTLFVTYIGNNYFICYMF